MDKNLEVIVNAVKLNETTYLLELPPELTNQDEKPFLTASPPDSSGKKSHLILDFSSVKKMNGLGASMLVKLSTLVKRRGQLLIAFGVSDHYRDVFRVTGLAKVLSICPNREEAYAIAGVSGITVNTNTSVNIAQDITYWAKPVSRLNVPPMPPEAINKNMKGLGVVGPVDGFGQLWQKTYKLVIDKPGLTPESIILTLKQNFPKFQPSYNRFYPTHKGISPGEVIAIDSSTPGGPVSTGVMVLYSDERSFTFITPQGHPESGWVTFSAFEMDGKIVAQILGLARANDPVFEAAFHTVGSKMQIKIWSHVLTSLANYLGIPADVVVEPLCVDSTMHWLQARNIWYNAQIRTLFYMPFRLLKDLFKNPEQKKK
jgi:anti-anti-sigma regulatory factor